MRQGGDHAAVALSFVNALRRTRAVAVKVEVTPGTPVLPDGKKRAYILDSIRHPAEVQLLRTVYQNAFVLLGVVCAEENTRIARLGLKYRDAGAGAAKDLMKRDAKADEKWGQRVSDAFHLADVFLDNSADEKITRSGEKIPNPDWDVADQLTRLIDIVSAEKVTRPTIHETAMYSASGGALRSACLSRQVGAALTDSAGTVVSIGTNEVPRYGGGSYVDSEESGSDSRCAYTKKYCSSQREQHKIVDEAIAALGALVTIPEGQRDKVKAALLGSRIGSLLEFSRAVHAEMDAILAAARTGSPIQGGRLYVTTYPCHYCARHIVSAGISEVQFIEPYPKSLATELHADSIASTKAEARGALPSSPQTRVLFRPFTGVAPRLYARAFIKDREYKNATGGMEIQPPEWGDSWSIRKLGYAHMEVELARGSEGQ